MVFKPMKKKLTTRIRSDIFWQVKVRASELNTSVGKLIEDALKDYLPPLPEPKIFNPSDIKISEIKTVYNDSFGNVIVYSGNETKEEIDRYLAANGYRGPGDWEPNITLVDEVKQKLSKGEINCD